MTNLQFAILLMSIWCVGNAQARGHKNVLTTGTITWMVITVIMWVKG